MRVKQKKGSGREKGERRKKREDYWRQKGGKTREDKQKKGKVADNEK